MSFSFRRGHTLAPQEGKTLAPVPPAVLSVCLSVLRARGLLLLIDKRRLQLNHPWEKRLGGILTWALSRSFGAVTDWVTHTNHSFVDQ